MSTTDSDSGDSRRDFLFIATGAAGAVTMGAIVWPLINQMNPAANVLALATVDADVSSLEPGSEIRVMWRGKPVFIRYLTEEDVAAAKEVALSELPDPIAQNENIEGRAEATIANRTIDEENRWLVQLGVCTHLGCVPLGDGAGDFGGWFCPCHGSHYDIAGRIRRGPAPRNLDIPTARFVDDTTIRLG